jgi:hypothetical protein
MIEVRRSSPQFVVPEEPEVGQAELRQGTAFPIKLGFILDAYAADRGGYPREVREEGNQEATLSAVNGQQGDEAQEGH